MMSRRFVCSECGMDFQRKFALNRHSQVFHDAKAILFNCTFPGCSYSTAQENNVKVHYNSKHLKKRQPCTLDGCSKEYYDVSSLIKHEKRFHGFYRKEQKAHAKRPADEIDANGVFVEDKHEMSAPIHSMWISSAVSTPSSTLFLPTPVDSSSSSPMSFASSLDNEPRSDDELLAEMIPELFSTPKSSPATSIYGSESLLQPSAYNHELDLQMPHISEIIPIFDYNLPFWNL